MSVFFRRKFGLTYLAHELNFWTIILVKIDFWSITTRTDAVIINVTFTTPANRFDWPIVILVAPFEISHVVTIIPRLDVKYKRKFVNLKFLIFRRMRIIESSLLKRNISTDKI